MLLILLIIIDIVFMPTSQEYTNFSKKTRYILMEVKFSFNSKRGLKMIAFSISFIGLIITNNSSPTETGILTSWLILWLYAPFVASFFIDWIVDIKDAKKERIKELKLSIKEYVRFDIEIESIWNFTFPVNYYYYRNIYNRFKEFEEYEWEEDIIINIISELKLQPVHPFKKINQLNLRDKKEEIKKYIFSDIPILPISKSDGSILAMIKFTSDISAIPYLYDINGVFLGGVRDDGTIFNKNGTYIGKLLNRVSRIYIEPYKSTFIAKFDSMPDIQFNEDEKQRIELIKKELNEMEDEWVKLAKPILLDKI